ncbi:MAG: hypothetical protein A2Y93_14220 [Chloroflexi bacterium RBG_13_68_17]|jgi:regulator of sigma E protease|nr:MAG: hypothetical protein A2Y93_14220 [Chloroflexi bacterium RBG_13_68_17]
MNDLLLFFLVAGGLILAHELGHFLVAKARHVAVDEFGFGFPPRLTTLFHAGGTRFSLNLIPFGGFVRLSGEDDPNVPGGFATSSKRTRALVLLAGPFSNMLIGFLAFTAAFRFAAPDLERVVVTSVLPGSPAESAGLLSGDILAAVDNVPINGFSAMQDAISARRGILTDLTVLREGQELQLQLVPRRTPPDGEGPIGVLLGNPTRPVGLGEAVSLGAEATASQVALTLRLPFLLAQGQVSPDEARVSGLKGIYDMLSWANAVDQATQRPFITLQLIGVISVGLGIANLLPIPALDGGRLVFLLIEALFRRRVAPRFEGLAHTVGFAVLLVLLVYITIQDFVNPIALPR